MNVTEKVNESMEIDLRGRVNSLKLAERNMLQPLFEAVVNSIQAIEDANIQDGMIEICLTREISNVFEENNAYIPAVQDFTIMDNGIGFDEKNYSSFKKAYSTHKSDRGGKGIGRFLWLKAFNDVKIESAFINDTTLYKRDIRFNLHQENNIEANLEIPVGGNLSRFTKVCLCGFKEPYRSKCPKKIETIATRIIEHCLIFFLSEHCPSIVIKDDTNRIDLNEKFVNLTYLNSFNELFTIGNYNFNLTLLKWFEHEENTYNRISLCAHHREVEDFNINKVFPDLNGKIFDASSGKYFLILGYLESDFLDSCVNEERTEVAFGKEGEIDFGQLTKQSLIAGLEPVIRKHFENVIIDSQKKKLETLHNFISEKAPQYAILAKTEGTLEKIVVTEAMSEQEIDLKLYKVYQEFEYESRAEVYQLLIENPSQSEATDFIREKYLQVLHKLSLLNKTKLAQYVVHRKYILEIFEKSLGFNEDGKYELEKTVHDIIFPTRKDSNEVLYEDQNLWLIDERLSYHSYLTSDKPLNKINDLNIESSNRPDLLIFNNPISFIEGDEPPFNSIILIEFKRPMRDRYDPEKDNPIEQIYDYVRKIKGSKQPMLNGRNYPISENTWFYTYLICDINDKIRIWASNHQLSKTFDGMGYYGFHKELKCMIEIIPFDQVLANAKKRNKILFSKLGI